MRALRRALGILVSLLALAGVLVTGVLVSRRIDQRPRTDDAYLQTASDVAFRSARDSYAQGVGTLTDATSAQTGLATARASVARAHAQSLINAAALAFATGELTSSADFAIPTSR